jgi:hypothetical protein
MALTVGNQNKRIETKLGKHLAAASARGTTVGSGNREHFKLPLPFRDSLEDGHPFGAHPGRVGGILDITTGEDTPTFRPQGCADLVIGIWRIGPAAGFVRQFDQETAFLVTQVAHFLASYIFNIPI